jgi:uncharacterized membrane protein YcjF (UPF0283 family)
VSASELEVSKNVRLSSYVKTHIVVGGVPIYLGAEMADDLLEGETFDDLSARIAGGVIEHLLTQIQEARTLTTRNPS